MLFVCVSAARALHCKCLVCPQGTQPFHSFCRTHEFFFAASATNVEPHDMFPAGSYLQSERPDGGTVAAEIKGLSERGGAHMSLMGSCILHEMSQKRPTRHRGLKPAKPAPKSRAKWAAEPSAKPPANVGARPCAKPAPQPHEPGEPSPAAPGACSALQGEIFQAKKVVPPLLSKLRP